MSDLLHSTNSIFNFRVQKGIKKSTLAYSAIVLWENEVTRFSKKRRKTTCVRGVVWCVWVRVRGRERENTPVGLGNVWQSKTEGHMTWWNTCYQCVVSRSASWETHFPDSQLLSPPPPSAPVWMMMNKSLKTAVKMDTKNKMLTVTELPESDNRELNAYTTASFCTKSYQNKQNLA